jgi:hypothetical protein
MGQHAADLRVNEDKPAAVFVVVEDFCRAFSCRQWNILKYPNSVLVVLV